MNKLHMKKITLALVFLVSLSFTATQKNNKILESNKKESSFTYVNEDSLSLELISLKSNTLEVSNKKIENHVEEKSELSNKGVISWYGKKFQGRYTSSGEKFDMNDLTAAHKTLPFGTKVKIRNPKNGKEVIVRITDRGPLSPKREFDLSQAAFKELANLGSGVLNVTYEIL